MKILIVPSWYATEDKPDSGVFFREQARALNGYGHEAVVAYADLRFRLNGLKTGLYKVHGAPVDTFICRKRSLTPYIQAGRGLQKAVMLEMLYDEVLKNNGRPDVVHMQSCRAAYETLRLCKKHRLPLVYTEHYSGVLEGGNAYLRRSLKASVMQCDAATAVSSALKEAMMRYGANVDVVPNLVDTNKFVPFETGSDRFSFVFAAMGNIVPVKGYNMLVEAFSRCCGEMPGSSLRIAGGGPEEEKLRRIVKGLGLEERVELLGSIPHDKAPEFINGCNCFVCSSIRETFGAVLIEALSCGKPVISTRCGGPLDIVNSSNGLLCDTADAGSLSRAMVIMYKNAHKYNAAKIREDCISRYGAEAVCKKLEEIYKKAICKAEGRA